MWFDLNHGFLSTSHEIPFVAQAHHPLSGHDVFPDGVTVALYVTR